MQNNPQPFALIGYIIAAALLLPLGWWLKANYAGDLAAWMRSFFY
ncbi:MULTISPECIES: hypothetical protein [Brucellaceae]|nr:MULTISPECIES: hypothetical protein [Brucellaceae]